MLTFISVALFAALTMMAFYRRSIQEPFDAVTPFPNTVLLSCDACFSAAPSG